MGTSTFSQFTVLHGESVAKVRKEQARNGTLPAYEPRTASFAEVRAWEKRTGRRFMELSNDERREAQEEMSTLSAQAKHQAAMEGLATH